MNCIDPLRRPLRVDFVTETYPPEINGAAQTVERMVHGLAQRGHRVRLIRPRQHAGDRGSDPIETLLVSGLPIPGYRTLRLGVPAGVPIARLWREGCPDVIYVATEGPLGWSAVRAAERAGVPVVSGFHTHFPEYMNHYGISLVKKPIYRYLRRLHNRTHATLVPTEELKQELGSDFHRLEVVGRGVDSELFSPAWRSDALRRRWGAGEDERVMLYVGRLAVEKNLPLALRTFRAIRKVDARVKFVVVGTGPLYSSLARNEEGIIFTGALVREELIKHYASADIFLFPSQTETFGNVTLEAMASGLAVVAFDYAAARMVIENGVNGMVAARGDHAAFIDAATALVQRGGHLEGIRAAARATAVANSWPGVLDRFEAIMRRCADEGPLTN